MAEGDASIWVKSRRLKLARDAVASASDAMTQLIAQPGIRDITYDPPWFMVQYDAREIRLADLIERLQDMGLELAGGIAQRIRIGVWHLCETIAIENAAQDYGWDTVVREIYMRHYRHRRHGRRDDRPQHWRKYMPRT